MRRLSIEYSGSGVILVTSCATRGKGEPASPWSSCSLSAMGMVAFLLLSNHASAPV